MHTNTTGAGITGAANNGSRGGVLAVISDNVANVVVPALRRNASFHPITIIADGRDALGFLSAESGFTIRRRPCLIIWELSPRRDEALLQELRNTTGIKDVQIIVVRPEGNGSMTGDGFLYLEKTQDVGKFQESVLRLAISLIPTQEMNFNE